MFSRKAACVSKNLNQTPDGLPKTTIFLDLGDNSLEKWNANFPKLKVLSIYSNKFAEIPYDLPESLVFLLMGNNDVKEIQLTQGSIKLFFFLRILFFDSTRFNSILCHFTFLHLGSKHLHGLSIPLNKIAMWPGDLHLIWPNLTYLDIRWNPFHCNKSLCPFLVWLAKVTHNFTDDANKATNWTILGTKMFVLHYTSFRCETPLETTRTLLTVFKSQMCSDSATSRKTRTKTTRSNGTHCSPIFVCIFSLLSLAAIFLYLHY